MWAIKPLFVDVRRYTSTQSIQGWGKNQADTTCFFLRKMLTQRGLSKIWNTRVKCGQYVVELWNTTNIGWVMGRDVVAQPPDVLMTCCTYLFVLQEELLC